LLEPAITARTLNWWSVTKCHQRVAAGDCVRSLDRLLTRSSDERLSQKYTSERSVRGFTRVTLFGCQRR
jgi:hypothetical protein